MQHFQQKQRHNCLLNEIKTNMVEIRHYNKSTIQQVDVLSGISPTLLKRVFVGWLVFAFIVEAIVFTAPQLSETFVNVTTASLILFTVLLWFQSRMAEGWPSIIHDNGMIGVVVEPTSREFLCASVDIIESIEPTIVKPNKKAVQVNLVQSQLTGSDKKQLEKAVWPRESQLIGLSHFAEPSDVCTELARFQR
jgi:hypothetical protein